MKIVTFNPQTGGLFTAANAQEIKDVVNANADILDEKASLVNGKIDPSQLVTIYFEGLEGSGTLEDPYRFTGSGGGSGNITPPAPTNGVVDDTANTFDFTYATGYTSNSDYQYSINSGGTYQDLTAKPISVGDVNLAIGAVRVRVKAATGRNPSVPLSNTVAFTASGGGSPELGTPITAMTYINGASLQSTNNIVASVFGENANGAVGLKIDDGATGWISQKVVLPFTESGEGGTGILNIGVGLDPYYGGSDAIDYFNVVSNGTIVYKGGSSSVGAAQNNAIVRLRATLTDVILEVSNDGGNNYTQVHTTTRPSGTLRFKFSLTGNQYKILDLRGYNLTTV